MFDDEGFVNHQHQSSDSQALKTIQRKISHQKLAAAHRIEQSNDNHMFESPHPRHPYFTSSEFDSSLRHSAGSRFLHGDNDIILTDGFNQQAFHQPHTRKVTKIIPKENYSLSNSRPAQPRSTSASSALPPKHETKTSTLTPSDIQRLKNVRRHEPAHVSSSSASKKTLITPDSWKTYPVLLKKPAKKKSTPETVAKPVASDENSKPVVEQPSIPKKPKRQRSASKPATIEPPKPVKAEKTKEEKEKIRKYIEEKRHEHEQTVSNEKQQKISQDKERKAKLKKLNEQIKIVAQQPLPPALIKKSTSAQLTTKDQSEQTRERMLHLLGPKIVIEPPTEQHRNTPFEQPALQERSPSSSSSSSSSSESIVEIQPPKIEQTIIRSRSEPPVQIVAEQRQQNILRWALNLTRDCGDIEHKFKSIRPDGTQPFDLIPPSQANPQHDDGNLRSPIPLVIKNDNKIDAEPIVPSKIVRPSGRLIKLNQNRTSEYQGQELPGVGNLRDPLLEQRVKRDRAAAKIQAVYRGYTVRKSIHWFNDKENRLNSEFNKRPAHKPKRMVPRPTDTFDTPALNLDMRLSDDNFTIGSTLLRHYQRNGVNVIPTTISAVTVQPRRPKIERPPSLQTYSDDYENITSTRSSTPVKQKRIPEKLRIIQQPMPNSSESTRTRRSSSSSSASSSSSSTPTLTPQRHIPTNIQRRRSISPPLPPQISSDNGRPVHHHRPPPITTTSHRISDERRYSPNALERQLNAELHLLDGVEASMKQVDNMERLRSVALAQQEVVSLAQVLKNKPPAETLPRQQLQPRSSPVRQISSSSSTSSLTSHQKRHSPSRRRPFPSTSSSSSEPILTAREKRARQKFNSEAELQAYETRLQDVEKKIRSLVKRASDMFEEKPSTHAPAKSSSESSISEDIPLSRKSTSSISTAIPQKSTNGSSEIRTESIAKESDSSQQQQSDTVTTDASDIERRIRAYQEQLKTKQTEFEQLKERKSKEALRRQEEELKKQLQTYNQQIENLRAQPALPKVLPATRKSPLKKSSSSSSSSSTPTKAQESSIAEDLPVTSTASQPKSDIVEKRAVVKKERNFFDEDDDEEEAEEKKPVAFKPVETPRDERDTQHDAQSLSITTDIAESSETDNDISRRPSSDNGKPILNLNTNFPSTFKSKEDSESSSSTPTSAKSAKQPSIERKSSPIVNDYDEDFSDVSRSPSTPSKEPLPKSKIQEIDIESVQEDLEDKPSVHDTDQSLSSKSSGDEQSEILVLVKKSASTTPRRQEDKTLEEELPLPPPPLIQKSELNNNDDTSHDVSEDEEVNEQENKVEKITEIFLRTFIDEAINQGKEIERLKKENNQNKSTLTQEAKEWVLEDEFNDEDYPEPIETESNELAIDLSELEEKTADEPRVESPRKVVVEESIKPFVPHTSEQVVHLCDQAIKILFDQNIDFSDRAAIQGRIPNSYFTTNVAEPENDDVRRNHQAYCQMIFNLTAEILHEMYSENIQVARYPDWQKTKLVSKRFYRGRKPESRREVEEILPKKVLELLNLNSRPITFSKWRISNGRRPGTEKFETVLDEEIRRSESQWLNYEDDYIQMKFDIADLILDQLIQETLTDCFSILEKRLNLNSNPSTRL